MKRILITLITTILIISIGGVTQASTTNQNTLNEGKTLVEENKDTVENDNTTTEDEKTETTKPDNKTNLEVELKLTGNMNIEQDIKTVDLILSVGKIEGDISDLVQCGIEAILTYDEKIITEIQATKIDEKNVANVTCLNKKLYIEMTGIKENQDLIKLTLTLKKDIEPSTVPFELKNIVFTKNGEGNQENSQVTNSKLTANIIIKENKPEEPKPEEPQPVEPKPEEPKDETEGDLIIKDPEEPQKEEKPQEETKQEDETISKENLPATGIRKTAILAIVVIAIGIIFLIKYKNIEIKPN